MPGMIYGYARVSTDAQDLTSQLAQLKAAGCEKVFREKITGTTADRPQLKKPMAALGHGGVVVIPAVDRLSCDTTDLLVLARDMQRAGAGLRSIAEPVVDTTSDFAELVLAMLALPRNLNAAASPNARRAADPMRRPRASNSAASPPSPHTSSKRHESGLQKARHSAASPAATMSVRRRFRGSARRVPRQ
jgi:hypothetical protein